jgi:hypothetical protein
VEPASLAERVKVALVSMVGSIGPESIVVSGGVLSTAWTVQPKLAGVGSTLPAASVARTSKVCGPTARPANSAGEVHAA